MQVLTAFARFIEQPLVAPLIALVGAVGTKAGYGGWAGGVLLSLISLTSLPWLQMQRTATCRPPPAL